MIILAADVRRRPVDILRAIMAARRDVEAYVTSCETNVSVR
jgi:hypothetical protein